MSKFIKEHQDWISRKISYPKNEFQYLGRTLDIKTNQVPHLKHYEFTKSGTSLKIEGPFRTISVSVLYEKWLFLEAKDYLLKRASHLAHVNGFNLNRITVRRQSSRWGSCSMKKNISLNYRLMKYTSEIIDYVIFHELCHLIEMNHSKNFWALVEKFVPDYKKYRRILKTPF